MLFFVFQEFISNFKTIIVPEALKAIQNGDDSFLSITKELNDLIAKSPIAFPKILESLQRCSSEKVNLLLILAISCAGDLLIVKIS